MQTRLNEDARRRLQHVYAPPMPSGPPITCAHHHPHETFVLPATQQRLYPQFAGYPMQSQLVTTPNRDLMRFSAASPEIKGNFSQNNNQAMCTSCCEECSAPRDNCSETSCSGCSHCSDSSNQTREGLDSRTLLQYSQTTPQHAQLNLVGKQVYI